MTQSDQKAEESVFSRLSKIQIHAPTAHNLHRILIESGIINNHSFSYVSAKIRSFRADPRSIPFHHPPPPPPPPPPPDDPPPPLPDDDPGGVDADEIADERLLPMEEVKEPALNPDQLPE